MYKIYCQIALTKRKKNNQIFRCNYFLYFRRIKMKSTPIYTNEEGLTLVKLEKAQHIEWLVCRNFDSTKEEGNKWSSASYFESFEDATRYLTNSISCTAWLMVVDTGVYKQIRIFRSKEKAEEIAHLHNEYYPDHVYIKEYDINESKWCEVSDVSSLRFFDEETDNL